MLGQKSQTISIAGIISVAVISAIGGGVAVAWLGADKPMSECAECPICEPPAPQGAIHLSQLDAASRERLREEVQSEIREETRAQWLAEFREQHPEQSCPEPAPEPLRPIARTVPSVAPNPLPPTQKIERDAGGMKILRQTFSTAIDHRLPIDERDVFSVSDASVFCFVEISAADAEDRMITIRFTHSTGLAQSYSLPVSQSPAWRTWSKLNLTKSMTGTWLCEIFNEDNVLLASKTFAVVD
ncbi:MAG: DUF2914 domain-containing protein [Proteobacteria bacterium]|nr:DUF2914 domain-containing protein [Pseudomonadota bacterium]